MEIRFAKKEDIKRIIEIENRCFPVSEAAKKEDIEKRFQAFSENFLVACKEGKVIGFINGCSSNTMELLDEFYHDCSLHDASGVYQMVFGLDVLPEYRCQGVARKLMEEFILLAKQRGKKGMILTCKDHLIHYYEKFGFVHQGKSESNHGGASWNDMLYIF